MDKKAPDAYIGQSVLRREDEYLLRGEGQYLDDIPEPQRTLHLAFVLSPHAAARIRHIDASEALKAPGVLEVLTGEDLAGLIEPLHAEIVMPTYQHTDRPVLAREQVRFVGEQVAVVVAEDRYAAQDGAELVQVDYELLPATASIEDAIRPDAPRVHAHIEGNLMFTGAYATAEFEQKHAEGELRLKERFRHGRVSATPMEPRGCLAVLDRADGVILYTSTQIPHIVRSVVAKHLRMSESNLRVVVPEVGGGFGMKAQVFPEELIAPALALRYRRPVKWVQDRREELLSNTHARDHLYEVEVAFQPDGIVTSMDVTMYADAGAYSSAPFGGTMEATGGARMVLGAYRIRNYRYKTHAVVTNTCPAGVYRGVAQPSCFMVVEGLMDRIGRQLGIDPMEVRLRNSIRDEDMPWVNALGVRYDTGSYVKCLQMARENSGYDAFRARQPANRMLEGKLRGIGICNMVEVTGTGSAGWRVRGLRSVSGVDSATLRVEPSGQITVYVSHASSGQGHLTTLAQVAAEELGAAMDSVRVVEGDTGATPFGSATFASRSAITGGGAIVRAAEKLTAKMRRLAAHALEVPAENIVLRESRAEVIGEAARFVSFQHLAEAAYSVGGKVVPPGEEFGLEATDYYDPPMVSMANAVHVVQVAVDPEDGRVAIEDYCVVHDCGRVINPMIVDGQIHGGIAQGIGEVLMEEIVYDENGQVLCASLLDYLLPSAMDVPARLTMSHVSTPSIDSVGGFKGVGEGGLIGAVPALLGAVADALAGLGVNINRTPLRPSYLSNLIHGASEAAK